MQKNTQEKMFYDAKDGQIMGLIGVLTPVVMSLVIGFLMVFVAIGAGKGYDQLFSSPVFKCVVQFICEAAFVVAVLVYNKIRKINFVSAGMFKTKPKPLNWVLVVVVGVLMPILFSPWISFWEEFLQNIGVKIATIGIPFETVGHLILCIVILGIVPAVCEEFMFRGVVLNGLRERGMWFAVLYSAMCFSLMHCSLQQLPYTFVLGFVVGIVVFCTRSIWLGMIIHALNNITVLVVGFITKDSATAPGFSSGDIIYAVVSMLLGIALIAGTIIFSIKYNKSQEISNPMNAAPKHTQKAFFSPWLCVATVLVCVVMIISSFM